MDPTEHTPSWVGRTYRFAVSEKGGHAIALAVCLGILVVAALLSPNPTGSERGLFLGDWKLPPMCGFRNITGIDCPGCGLTRSFVAAMNGSLAISYERHRLGWLCILYVMLQIGRQTWWLMSGPDKSLVQKWGYRLDFGLLGIATLLLINWTLKMFGI